MSEKKNNNLAKMGRLGLLSTFFYTGIEMCKEGGFEPGYILDGMANTAIVAGVAAVGVVFGGLAFAGVAGTIDFIRHGFKSLVPEKEYREGLAHIIVTKDKRDIECDLAKKYPHHSAMIEGLAHYSHEKIVKTDECFRLYPPVVAGACAGITIWTLTVHDIVTEPVTREWRQGLFKEMTATDKTTTSLFYDVKDGVAPPVRFVSNMPAPQLSP